MKRLGLAGLVATGLAVALATHGFTRAPLVRIKALRAPAAPVAGRVLVPFATNANVAGLRPPVALIWRVRNDSGSAASFELDVDGRAACRESIKAHAEQRLDCILSDPDRWAPAGQHTAEIRSEAPAWTLTYLEAATHEGRLSDPLNVLLLPKGSKVPEPPTDLEVAGAWVLVAALLLVPVPRSRARRLLTAHRVASGCIVGLFALIVVTPLVSPYTLVFSIATFWRAVAVLLAWRIWSAARVIVAAARAVFPAWKARLATVGVALLVGLIYGGLIVDQVQVRFHGNYSGFLHIAAEFFDDNPILPDREVIRPHLIIENPGGYDGQYFYLMTFDPFLRRFHDQPATYNRVVDAPPYRFGRIGLSVLTKVVSLNRWRWYPAVIIWLVFGGVVTSAAALSAIAQARGTSALWGVLILAVPGFWLSVQLGLPEPLAAGFLLAGIWSVIRGWWVLGAVLCAASLLTRETGVVAVACLAIWVGMSGRRSMAIRFAVIAFLPIALWRLYLGFTLYPAWGLQAFFYNSHDVGVPLMGIATLWQHVGARTYYPGLWDLSRAAIVFPLLLLAGLGFAVATVVLLPSPFAIAAAAYGLVAISLRFGSVWVHVGNGERVSFELFVMLAVTSAWMADAPRALRAIRLLFWVLAGAYVLFGSFEAPGLRQTLLSLL